MGAFEHTGKTWQWTCRSGVWWAYTGPETNKVWYYCEETGQSWQLVEIQQWIDQRTSENKKLRRENLALKREKTMLIEKSDELARENEILTLQHRSVFQHAFKKGDLFCPECKVKFSK